MKPAALLLALAACRTSAPQPAPLAVREPPPAAPAPAAAASAQSAPPVQAASTAQPAAPAPEPLTSEEAAQAALLAQEDCLSCHSAQMLEQQRLTPKQWEAEVKKMQGWGAPVDPDEVSLLAQWLAREHGPAQPPYLVPLLDPRDAEAALAPQPDGRFAARPGPAAAKKGALLWESHCQSCHGPTGRGAAMGVALADKPILFRAAEFANVIRAGRYRMPQYDLSDASVASILAYLRSLPREQ